MNEEQARDLLENEHARIEGLLAGLCADRLDDRSAESEEVDDDRAAPLTAEDSDDAVAAGLRYRLAAVERAEQRLEDGTYGRSVRSGAVIPDERLLADPAAELTAEEAARDPG